MTHYPPGFVYDNIDSMHKLRKAMQWTQLYIAKTTGIPRITVHQVEYGILFPSRNLYNKLAKLFEWEVWT